MQTEPENIITEKTAAEISLEEFRNKLYIDPEFGEEQNSARVNYAVLTNKWNIEDINEDYSVRIVHPQSGDGIILSFSSFKDKLAFMQNIYTSQYIKQVGRGHDLESLANLNLLYAERNNHEENILVTLFYLFKTIFVNRILPRLSMERIANKVRSIFKKGQFAS